MVIEIDKIKLNKNNPRVIEDSKFNLLVESIKEFPEMLELRPIVVNSDMVVLGGNMRLKACKEAGLKKVPILVADNLSKEQQLEFIIKDNIGYGEWDWEIIQADWDMELLENWGLNIPNFSTSHNKDLSDKIVSEYKIEIVCENEKHQEHVYNKLIEQGYECRILNL